MIILNIFTLTVQIFCGSIISLQWRSTYVHMYTHSLNPMFWAFFFLSIYVCIFFLRWVPNFIYLFLYFLLLLESSSFTTLCFRRTAKWLSYTYTYIHCFIFLFRFFSYIGHQGVLRLFCAAGWLPSLELTRSQAVIHSVDTRCQGTTENRTTSFVCNVAVLGSHLDFLKHPTNLRLQKLWNLSGPSFNYGYPNRMV